MGPKIFSAVSAEEDDYLGLGPEALFIEDPYDTSNRPNSLKVTIKDLGEDLEKLFLRAFVDGLHDPAMRPTAMEWERGLVRAWDLLHRCSNPDCDAKWFVLHDVKNPVCPFCKTRITDRQIVRLTVNTEVRGHKGQWRKYSELDAVNNTPLFKWHTHSNIFPDEKADTAMQAYVCFHGGEWFLINSHASGMLSPLGNPVPAGQAIRLKNGTVFRASRDDRGTLISVNIYGN
jgi:hypothetical protein